MFFLSMLSSSSVPSPLDAAVAAIFHRGDVQYVSSCSDLRTCSDDDHPAIVRARSDTFISVSRKHKLSALYFACALSVLRNTSSQENRRWPLCSSPCGPHLAAPAVESFSICEACTLTLNCSSNGVNGVQCSLYSYSALLFSWNPRQNTKGLSVADITHQTTGPSVFVQLTPHQYRR